MPQPRLLIEPDMLVGQLHALLGRERDPIANAANVAASDPLQ